MKVAGLLIATFSLSACSDDARWAAECEASRQLYRAAVAAMCEPWGERREAALSALVDASRDGRFEEPVTGEAIDDYVDDIDAKDCVDAGYVDLGIKPVDPDRERIRERLKAIPPPPGFTPERIKPLREGMKRERTCKLNG